MQNIFLNRNKIQLLFIVLFIFVSSTAIAGTFYVRINAEGGITAADTLVEQGQQVPVPVSFLMDTLTAYPPQYVEYLIRDRPTGNLLELVNQSPDSPLARIYRYIIISYPFGIDVTPILQSFQNDPLVDIVYYMSGTLNPVVFEPEPLVVGLNTFVNLDISYECEEASINVQGLTHNVIRNGNIIELEAVMNYSQLVPPAVCYGPQPNELINYDLGRLDAGSYTLKIYKVYVDDTFPVDINRRHYIGEKDFQVLATNDTVQTIPVFSFMGILLLMFIFIVAMRASIYVKV